MERHGASPFPPSIFAESVTNSSSLPLGFEIKFPARDSQVVRQLLLLLLPHNSNMLLGLVSPKMLFQ